MVSSLTGILKNEACQVQPKISLSLRLSLEKCYPLSGEKKKILRLHLKKKKVWINENKMGFLPGVGSTRVSSAYCMTLSTFPKFKINVC